MKNSRDILINKMNLSGLIINHPGRNEALLYFDKNCAAATPPSKGGETYTNISSGKAICNPPPPAPPSLAPPKRLREGDEGEPIIKPNKQQATSNYII